jgi:transposase InsO family protein
MVRGLPAISHIGQFCDTCVITKHHRASFLVEAQYYEQEPLELVHGDLCGPVTPATPRGMHYFLLLVDDATRYMWVALLMTKDAATDAIKHLQAMAEKGSGRKLQVLRTDNAREFTAVEFAAHYADEGIPHYYSAPYSPQQNGVMERRNQMMVAMARALLKQRNLPTWFWGRPW